MSKQKPEEILHYVTDQTYLYYDPKSDHIIISVDENSNYIPFEGEDLKTDKWHTYQDMPKNSLYFIFATNAHGFNLEQRATIMNIKELLLGHTNLNQSPILISEKHLFEIIDEFQHSLTKTQINALLTKEFYSIFI